MQFNLIANELNNGQITLQNLFYHFAYIGRISPAIANYFPLRFGWMFLLGGAGYFLRKMIDNKFAIEAATQFSNIALLSVITIFILVLQLDAVSISGVFKEPYIALLAFILVIFIRDDASLSVMLTNKYSLFIGSISYSFYLTHALVIEALSFDNVLDVTDKTALFFIYLATSTLVTFIWYKVFEQYIYQKVKGYIIRR